MSSSLTGGKANFVGEEMQMIPEHFVRQKSHILIDISSSILVRQDNSWSGDDVEMITLLCFVMRCKTIAKCLQQPVFPGGHPSKY